MPDADLYERIGSDQGVVSHEGKVGDFPITMPVSAIEAIGAGGGSIAWLDGPILKVGPRSAGATPGPACYGKGGVQPTLSDAYLVCGYLSEDAPLSDWIDSGVLDSQGKPLYMVKHKIERNETDFTILVDRLPAKAGIDPWNKLVDRKPDDNAVKVTKL